MFYVVISFHKMQIARKIRVFTNEFHHLFCKAFCLLHLPMHAHHRKFILDARCVAAQGCLKVQPESQETCSDIVHYVRVEIISAECYV